MTEFLPCFTRIIGFSDANGRSGHHVLEKDLIGWCRNLYFAKVTPIGSIHKELPSGYPFLRQLRKKRVLTVHLLKAVTTYRRTKVVN